MEGNPWEKGGYEPCSSRGSETRERVIISNENEWYSLSRYSFLHEGLIASKTVKLYSRLTNRANNLKTNLSM